MARTYEDSALKALCERLQTLGSIRRYENMVYEAETPFQWRHIHTPESRVISYGDLYLVPVYDEIKWTFLFEPNYMTYSDYSGSSLERANCDVFLEKHEDTEGVYETCGDFGTRGVAVMLSAITDDMLEDFESLEDYPSLDDDALSNLEMEMETEDWKAWIEHDLRRALKDALRLSDDDDKATCDPGIEEMIDALDDEKLFTLYRTLCERTSTYWKPESAVGGTIDLERLVKAATVEDLQ